MVRRLRKLQWVFLIAGTVGSLAACDAVETIAGTEVPDTEIPDPTHAELRVTVDEGTCSRLEITVVEAFLDGQSWGTLQLGTPFSRNVTIGDHIFFGQGKNSSEGIRQEWGPSTWNVSAQGQHRVLTCT